MESPVIEKPKYDIASHSSFHIYEFNERFYIYDIKNMRAFEVNKSLYNNLNTEEEIRSLLNKIVESKEPVNKQAVVRTEPEPLVNIFLNVAQVCNLSCSYCYGVDGEYGLKGKMNEEVAFRSIDFLVKESGKEKSISIQFFGGEPLLNFPLVKKCVDYARNKAKENNKKISFSITTNGTKFNPEINEFLNSNNFSVMVSFDGDEETQNKNRPLTNGGESYNLILPKVKEFLKSREGKAVARATVTNNTSDLIQLKKKLRDIGFNKTAASVATVSDFATNNRDLEKNLSEESSNNLFIAERNEAEEILNCIKNRKDLVQFGMSKVYGFLVQLKQKNQKHHACGVGRRMVGIAINGDVYPCHRFVGEQKFKLGNVKNFDSSVRTKYSTDQTENHPVCSKCWAKYQCGGMGCIQDNEVMVGDVNNINIKHCTLLKYQLKLAIEIYNNLDIDDINYFS